MCDKINYPSQYLATNAATLHSWINPNCKGINVYECDDCHDWHIGHPEGAKCKKLDNTGRIKENA